MSNSKRPEHSAPAELVCIIIFRYLVNLFSLTKLPFLKYYDDKEAVKYTNK